MIETAPDILTRDQVCRDCDASDFVGGGDYLTCEHVTDGHGHPITCRLRAMLADPEARCPSPNQAQAQRWNDAAVVKTKGCSGESRTATPTPPGVLTLRVRACLGHGDQPRCEHAGEAWHCRRLGRSIAADLKDPAFACPDGRFSAEVQPS